MLNYFNELKTQLFIKFIDTKFALVQQKYSSLFDICNESGEYQNEISNSAKGIVHFRK